MTLSFLKHRKEEIVSRFIVDGVLTNISAILALGIPVLHYTIAGKGAEAVALATVSRHYYLETFIPLSLLFPLAFLLNGFYTGTRGYEGRYKPLVVMRGILSGGVLFGLGSYLVSSRVPGTPNMTLLCTSVLAAAASVRLFKAAVVRQFSIERKHSATDPSSRGVVLVVGGAGYIGSTLVRRLLEAGYRVRILDSLIYSDAAIRDILDHPRLDFRIGDCRNIKTVIAAVNGVHSIIHLAAIVGDPACDLDHKTALEINYAATRMLIEVAKGHKVARFIFASSCSVYGATEQVMDEVSATAPLSVYAQTKIDSEDALIQACDGTFHPTIMRLATVFGNSSRPRFDLVVNLLTARAHADGIITIYNGEQWRPFIHVADVARGVIVLLEAPIDRVSGQIFNLGDSRQNHTLSDVAERIHFAFPLTRITHIDNKDRRNYRVSFDKAHGMLGFECNFNLDYGIRELKQALESGAIPDYTDERYHNQRFLQSQGSPATSAPIDVKVMAAFASSSSALTPAPASKAAFTHA